MVIQGINVAKIMTYLINEVACTMEYNWSNDFNHEDLKRYYDNVQEEMAKIDFNQLTDDELRFLGFKNFSENSKDYLVPLWLLRALPNGTKLQSLMGTTVEVGRDYIDNDIRGGFTAFSLIQNG